VTEHCVCASTSRVQSVAVDAGDGDINPATLLTRQQYISYSATAGRFTKRLPHYRGSHPTARSANAVCGPARHGIAEVLNATYSVARLKAVAASLSPAYVLNAYFYCVSACGLHVVLTVAVRTVWIDGTQKLIGRRNVLTQANAQRHDGQSGICKTAGRENR